MISPKCNFLELPCFRLPEALIMNFLTRGVSPRLFDSGAMRPSGKRKSISNGTGLSVELTTVDFTFLFSRSHEQISSPLEIVADRSKSLTLEGR